MLTTPPGNEMGGWPRRRWIVAPEVGAVGAEEPRPDDYIPPTRIYSSAMIEQKQTPGPGYVDDREAVLRRLARIEGQVRGVRRMVEDEAYCIDVLTQIAAVDKALDGVALKLLADHTNHCVRDAVAHGGDDGDEKVRELLAAVERFARTR